MNRDIGEAIAIGLQEVIHHQESPDAVMFWQVKTIKGAAVSRWLVEFFKRGSFDISNGISVHVGSSVVINLRNAPESVEIDFQPPPNIKADIWGLGNYNIKLEGITVLRDELKLILGGFKDLTIAIED
jgi:hypothetical protein